MKNRLTLRLFAGICLLLLLCAGMRFAVLSGFTRAETTAAPAPLYVLREYNGSLAVFRRGLSFPEEIFPVPVSTLPPADRERVQNGIAAESDAEIQRIIEDYTG